MMMLTAPVTRKGCSQASLWHSHALLWQCPAPFVAVDQSEHQRFHSYFPALRRVLLRALPVQGHEVPPPEEQQQVAVPAVQPVVHVPIPGDDEVPQAVLVEGDGQPEPPAPAGARRPGASAGTPCGPGRRTLSG